LLRGVRYKAPQTDAVKKKRANDFLGPRNIKIIPEVPLETSLAKKVLIALR
jgi:hypothetical protein